MALLIATLYALALGLVTLFGLNQGWLAWKRAGSRGLQPGPVPAADVWETDLPEPPNVTVQLPLYNEALVAERLIDAVAAMRYPKSSLEIQVLDDSTDETTAIVAAAVRRWRSRGFRMVHLHRKQRTGYKAGALADGLRIAKGEFIAVFDADFIPRPDFLMRVMPSFERARTGCVQTRWEYLNTDASLLTRLQAMGLDGHFEVEHRGRRAAGYFTNFNGTAGVWRKSCVLDAGGWSSDTLTEDLDLSYRAQLRGWEIRYMNDLAVPSELPADMAGFRSQQRRWTIGSVQTARKLVGSVWRSPLPAARRIQGVLHLTANGAYPIVLILAVLNAPVALLRGTPQDPGSAYYALLSLGALGLAGYAAAHLAAQRGLRADWPRRMVRFPILLAGSMGLALAQTIAVFRGLGGDAGPFVRTAKFADSGDGSTWWRTLYANRRLPPVTYAETALAVALTAGAWAIVDARAWGALPFQILFAAGAWIVVWASVSHTLRVRRAIDVESRNESNSL